MNMTAITAVFESAEKEGRSFLLEHEVYALLRLAGLPTPRHVFVPKGGPVRKADLATLGSGTVVLKVVSPLILHKSDAGGVRFAKAEPRAVNAACEEMLAGVPGRFLEWSKRIDRAGGQERPTRKAVADSLRGVLVCEKVAFDDVGFGSEILAGIRNTREFGPVMTVGGGGLDVEYMNERIKEGRSAALFSIALVDEARLGALIEPLAFFGKVALPFRGRKPLITPATLTAALRRLVRLARSLSSFAGSSPYIIEELEVNPLVIRDGGLVPLDGLCRFSRAGRAPGRRPYAEIGRLLRPDTIGIVGVSEKRNIGRIILENILKNGFPKEKVFVVKPGLSEIAGCRCVPSVRELPVTVDMFVLTLGAEQSVGLMRELAKNEKARSVILIAGGLGEKEGSQGLEAAIREIIAGGRAAGRITPVVNGGNCLGIASKPGRYDTTFIPEDKLPRPRGPRSDMAVISQSGAFMISRMSKMPRIEPRYAVSLGNQIDLTASDYLNFLKDEPEVRTFAVYMEGFRPGDGHAFAGAVKEITAAGRTVIVYKSGRSPEGRGAASSHTASVAGDYPVCRSVLEQAGGIICADIEEFENMVRGFESLADKKTGGNRVGLVSNAGFECVIMADSLKGDGGGLELAAFSPETRARIAAVLQPLGIDRLQDVHNPLDVTPVADDAAFYGCAEAVLEDPHVDCAVISPVPMTPAMRTLGPSPDGRESILDPESFAQRVITLFGRTDKPFVVNVDAGKVYDPMCELLEEAGIPVFRRSDEALRFLRRYVAARCGRKL
jgi:acyl-CoA synthetase (NDP forming)